MDKDVQQVVQALSRAQRILIITGAGLSAESGLPTYRGLGGLYNGLTADGIPIEEALSGQMLRDRPELCWTYLAELGRACLAAAPNRGHQAIARLQQLKPQCWVLTQNIDGYHRQAGSPAERLIEIHGQMAPLYCQSCGAESAELLAHLQRPLPPGCARCGGILRPPVVLFGEMLPEGAIDQLYHELRQGFDVVLSVGTTASFPYIAEPVWRTRQAGGLTVEINPEPTDLSRTVDVAIRRGAGDVLCELVSHISSD